MLYLDKTQVQFSFDSSIPPRIKVDSGETICFQCRDCYNEQITFDNIPFSSLDMTRGNPVTGPLYINGAEPGDVVRVELLAIALEDHAVMCIRTGKGVYAVEGCHCRRFPIRENRLYFDQNIQLPLRPMVGVIGTCPKEPCSTHSPGQHGGNLDIRELGTGSVIYLPVFVPGALLSMGDLHALQGDGESAICGAEASGEVTVKITLMKGLSNLPLPFLATKQHFYTTACSSSLDECSLQAARKMHEFLQSYAKLTDAQAAMLLSLHGNLRISQIVNPKKGCIMEFPRKIPGFPWSSAANEL